VAEGHERKLGFFGIFCFEMVLIVAKVINTVLHHWLLVGYSGKTDLRLIKFSVLISEGGGVQPVKPPLTTALITITERHK